MQKKILFFLDSLKTIGGAEQMFIDQANFFTQQGIEVHFALSHSPKRDDWSKELSIGRQVEYFYFGGVFDVRSHLALRKYCKAHNITVLYSCLDYSNMVARVAKLFNSKIRVVVVEPGDPRRKTRRMRMFDRFATLWVYKVFAMGGSIRKQLLEYLHPYNKKIVTMRNGVHPMASLEQTALRWGKKRGNMLQLLHVGNMNTENKGHQGILKAVEILQKQYPEQEIHITFIGEGRLKQDLMGWVSDHGITDMVHFVGFVPHDQIAELYRNADVFVFNSKTEGGAASIMEATSAGLPTVTSDFESVHEVTIDGETGYVVPHNDAEAFARAIMELANSPDCYMRMGKAARELYERQFAYTARAQEFIDQLFA